MSVHYRSHSHYQIYTQNDLNLVNNNYFKRWSCEVASDKIVVPQRTETTFILDIFILDKCGNTNDV